jgi:hypothetical protein
MDRSAVVALVVVLQHHLPVCCDLILDPPRHPQLGERIAPEPLRHAAELCRQRAAFCLGFRGGEMEEDEAAPRVHADRMEREGVLGESIVFVEKRGGAELALERVRPGVVRAADGAREVAPLAVGDELGAAVPADVVVRGERAVPRPHE